MKSLEQMVIEDIQWDIKHYEEKIKDIREKELKLRKIARVLDTLSLEENKVYLSGNMFVFETKDSKEALDLTSRLLDLFTEIEKFNKEFDLSYGKWDWVANIPGDEIGFRVKNATPAIECTPIQVEHTYKTWECRKEGG